MKSKSHGYSFYARVTLPKVRKLGEAAVFSERPTQKYANEDGKSRSKAKRRKKSEDDVVKDESEDERDQNTDEETMLSRERQSERP